MLNYSTRITRCLEGSHFLATSICKHPLMAVCWPWHWCTAQLNSVIYHGAPAHEFSPALVCSPHLSLREKVKKNEYERSGSGSVFPPPPLSAVQGRSVKPRLLLCLTCFGKRREVSGPEYFPLAPTCYICREKKGGGERGKRERAEKHECHQLSQPNYLTWLSSERLTGGTNVLLIGSSKMLGSKKYWCMYW